MPRKNLHPEKNAAQKIKDSYRQVDLVFGPHALWRFPELLYRLVTRRGRIFDITDEPGSIAEGIPVVRQDRVKAWVSIMYGCNNFCTYCIVPYVRGRERSRKPEVILEEIRGLVADGYKDITLLGQNVNSYGKDLEEPMDFADLLKAASEIEGDFLLRFMTSHPKDASQKLFDTMASSPKIAPCFHLPFQAGSLPGGQRPGAEGHEPGVRPGGLPGQGAPAERGHSRCGHHLRRDRGISRGNRPGVRADHDPAGGGAV